MESCSRACAAMETGVSLAKRGPPEVACGPTEAPSGVWAESGAVVGRHTEVSVANREPRRPVRGGLKYRQPSN